MVRYVLAACLAIAVAACSPALKIDQEDPWATLHPWNHGWKEIEKTEGGVEYIIVKKGPADGAFPSAVDQVEVHYDGRLATDATQFDSSEGGPPARFRLNGVIPGWTEALQKLQPGDVAMLWIPSAMGYGEAGAGGVIGPNADLMFLVELLSVTAAAASDPEAWAKVTPWPTDSSDVIRTPSGLEYLVVKSGDPAGVPPGDNDYAFVHYEGRLEDGTVVDSTFESQRPRPFPIADLVPGWNEALKLMRTGDQWMVRIPAHLMYGDEGDGRIPPGAAVTFEVLLDNVVVIEPPPEEPQQ